jgi:hypothetical protein
MRTKKSLGPGDRISTKDPPHGAPIDGKGYADKRDRAKAQLAGLAKKGGARAGCERQSRHDETRENGKSLRVGSRLGGAAAACTGRRRDRIAFYRRELWMMTILC